MYAYEMCIQWFQSIWENLYNIEYYFRTLTEIYDWNYNEKYFTKKILLEKRNDPNGGAV